MGWGVVWHHNGHKCRAYACMCPVTISRIITDMIFYKTEVTLWSSHHAWYQCSPLHMISGEVIYGSCTYVYIHCVLKKSCASFLLRARMLMCSAVCSFFRLTIEQLKAIPYERYPPRSVPVLECLITVMADGIGKVKKYEKRSMLKALYKMQAEEVRIWFTLT